MEKYYCENCLWSFYLTYDENVEVEGQPACPECGSINMVDNNGYVTERLYEVTRTWHVEAYHHQEALDKTRNFDHCGTSVKVIKEEIPLW